jgi:anti-sigma factor (TIGR02949 family)
MRKRARRETVRRSTVAQHEHDTAPARLGCRQVRRTLQAFLDGEITPDRAEQVAAHLESCTRCSVEAEILERVIATLRRLRPDLDLAAYTRLLDAVDRIGDHEST